MCFHYSVTKAIPIIEKRYGSVFLENYNFNPVYHAFGFNFPKMPVITNQATKVINMFSWGLIPFWIGDTKSSESIRAKTLNARSDTISLKPSFKSAFKTQRCLVIADGFFEWKLQNNKKYPYYIRMKDNSLFSFAGLWDKWIDKISGVEHYTFTIITVEANKLLSNIHNTKFRMPAILSNDSEEKWLSNNYSIQQLKQLLIPYPDGELEAYPVSLSISNTKLNTDNPDIIKKVDNNGLF